MVKGVLVMSNGKDTLNATKKLISLADFDNGIKHGLAGTNGEFFTATKCQFDVGVGLVSPEGQARARKLFKVLAENNIVGKDGFGCFMRSYTNAEKEEKLAAQRAEQSTRDASMAELLLEAMALDVPRADLASSARKAFEANTTVAQFQIDAVAAEIVDLQDITFPAAETDDERENVKSLIAKLENLRNGIREKADAIAAEKAK